MTPHAPEIQQDLVGLEATGLTDPNMAVLLDAAANNQIPELLQEDSSDANCLWKGAARDNLGEQAPWIASLNPNGRILKNLTTQGSAPWQWWGRWPGILIQHRRGVDKLLRHLRRFSKVTDKDQRSYLLRFWEPTMAEAFWASHDNVQDHVAWRFGEDVEAVYWPTTTGICKVSLPNPVPTTPAPENAIEEYRPLFRVASWHRFQSRIADALKAKGHPFDAITEAQSAQLCDSARASGYKSEAAIWDVVRATILFDAAGRDMQKEAQQAWGETEPPDEKSAARRLFIRAQSVSENGQGT